MTVDLEDRVGAALHAWADRVPVGTGDVTGSIVLARRRRAARRSIVAAVGLIVGVLAALVAVRPTANTVHTASGPESTFPVELPLGGVPQIVLPGWRTTYFLAMPGPIGEPTYVEYQFESDDGTRLQLSFYGSDVTVRTGGEERLSIEVRGTTGSLLDYGDGRYRADWVEGGRVWEADGSPFASPEAFASTLASLQHADAATWEASLPENTTMPSDRAAGVASLLAGVPLPDGFDRTALDNGPPAMPYYLATDVYGRVACAWIGEWGAALATGDAARAQAAATALAGSHGWPGLAATTAEGAYADVLWELAQRVVDGDRSVLDAYQSALGC